MTNLIIRPKSDAHHSGAKLLIYVRQPQPHCGRPLPFGRGFTVATHDFHRARGQNCAK